MEMHQTCWRGMWIQHPTEWELSHASRLDQPGQCTFTDPAYQRLDVRWRPLTYVPNLQLMLTRYRKHESRDDETELIDLTGAPPEWLGVVRRTPQAWIVHAGRFFREARLLV